MRSFLAAAVLACAAAPALAQTTELAQPAPAGASLLRIDPRTAPAADASLLTELPAQAAPEPAARRSSAIQRTVIPGALGAIVGGWIGYVASQASRSDWDEEENGDFNSYRMGFAAGGAALGALGGAVLGRSAGSGRAGATPRMVQSNGSDVILAEEIRQSTARNAYEMIRNLRPRWLQTRGTSSFGEATRGQSTSDAGGVSLEQGQSAIKVYMNNTPLGDVTILRTLDVGSFSEIRYFDSAQATYKWGQGHFGGAIEIITTPTE